VRSCRLHWDNWDKGSGREGFKVRPQQCSIRQPTLRQQVFRKGRKGKSV
jgi:hypothetical protein